MSDETQRRTVWVAYTNSDCTEGRGYDIPIAVCAMQATAIRLSRRMYVQGSDGPVRPAELVKLDGQWYVPSAAVTVVEPTEADKRDQAAIDARQAAIKKAKALGLSVEDIEALRSA